MALDIQRIKERLEHKQTELQELPQDLTGGPIHLVHEHRQDEVIQQEDAVKVPC